MNDQALIQIVDAAVAEAVRRSGPWVVCRPGCNECCLGPFSITQADAQRLRQGLAELASQDPERASRIRERARQYAASDDEPCPALDPESGLCDLYAARPVLCRTFGPPIRDNSGAVVVCELCVQGASDDEIDACAVEVDQLDAGEETSVAAALTGTP